MSGLSSGRPGRGPAGPPAGRAGQVTGRYRDGTQAVWGHPVSQGGPQGVHDLVGHCRPPWPIWPSWRRPRSIRSRVEVGGYGGHGSSSFLSGSPAGPAGMLPVGSPLGTEQVILSEPGRVTERVTSGPGRLHEGARDLGVKVALTRWSAKPGEPRKRRTQAWGSRGRRFKSCQPDQCDVSGILRRVSQTSLHLLGLLGHPAYKLTGGR